MPKLWPKARPDADKVIIEGMTHLLKTERSDRSSTAKKRLFIWMLPRLFPKKLVSVMADFIRRI